MSRHVALRVVKYWAAQYRRHPGERIERAFTNAVRTWLALSDGRVG